MKIYLRKISHPLLSNLRALSRVSLINSRSLPERPEFFSERAQNATPIDANLELAPAAQTEQE
jgi:hypothetical protein